MSLSQATRPDVEFAHIEEMVRLMAGPAGKKTRVPGRVTLEVDHNWAHLSTGEGQVGLLPELEQSRTRLQSARFGGLRSVDCVGPDG